MSRSLASILRVAAIFLLPSAATMALAQLQATLRVEVRPEALIVAPSSLVWAADAPASTLQIPLNVKLRLHRGTSAELSIARTDQSGEAVIEADGKGGWRAVSSVPVGVRGYGRSGSYNDSLLLRLASPPGESSELGLVVRLSYSDGSVEAVHNIQLQVQPGLVSQGPAPLGP